MRGSQKYFLNCCFSTVHDNWTSRYVYCVVSTCSSNEFNVVRCQCIMYCEYDSCKSEAIGLMSCCTNQHSSETVSALQRQPRHAADDEPCSASQCNQHPASCLELCQHGCIGVILLANSTVTASAPEIKWLLVCIARLQGFWKRSGALRLEMPPMLWSHTLWLLD